MARGSDVFVSIHRLFSAFPFSVDVLLLDTAGIQSSMKEGNLAALIRYDFTRPNTLSVRDHGVIPLADLGSHAELVGSLLELDEGNFESCENLGFVLFNFSPTTWMWCRMIHVLILHGMYLISVRSSIPMASSGNCLLCGVISIPTSV